jgi:DNA-binding MarR family transcriptional regulator
MFGNRQDGKGVDLPEERYTALAEFRYQIRRFQHVSEDAARRAGLEPQQHQLLLAIKGAPEGGLTIGEVAERLQVRHHSAVELVARAAARGLVVREKGEVDRRKVFVFVTNEGTEALSQLSAAHHQEMLTAAPDLVRVLQRVIAGDGS